MKVRGSPSTSAPMSWNWLKETPSHRITLHVATHAVVLHSPLRLFASHSAGQGSAAPAHIINLSGVLASADIEVLNGDNGLAFGFQRQNGTS